MSKKDPKKAEGAEKPFFRPFEAVAKEKLAEIERAKKAREEHEKSLLVKGKLKPQQPAPKASPSVSRPGGSRPEAHSPRVNAAPSAGASMGDDESFASMLYGVKPLAKGKRGAPEPAPRKAEPAAASPQPAPEPPADESVREHLRELVSGGDSRFEISDDGTRIEGRRVDVDKHVVRRLRRGEMMVDVSVDLHGLTAHDARAKLEEAVQKARNDGERVLLVVCGKGNNSPRGVPILRGEMAAWLSQGSASVHVAAFVTALPDDGGEGALYVLLRR